MTLWTNHGELGTITLMTIVILQQHLLTASQTTDLSLSAIILMNQYIPLNQILMTITACHEVP